MSLLARNHQPNEAQDARRETFKLLFGSGIITARELRDDLTIISDAHIEECVSIASSMLEVCPFETWMKLPHETKRIFEERLTALYTR